MAVTTDAQTIDMTSKPVNFLITQGDTRAFTTTFPAGTSLVGSTAKMTIKDRNGNTLLTLQSGAGITLSGQVFTTTITKAQSELLPVKSLLLYDWQWTDSASVDTTVHSGTLQVKPQITP